mgnify:CR=1 FL=1
MLPGTELWKHDGPIRPDVRMLEELEEAFRKEKERIKDIKWTPELLKE